MDLAIAVFLSALVPLGIYSVDPDLFRFPNVKHVYAQFPKNNGTKFTHMVLDVLKNQIFAGAVNKILHLDSDLVLKEEVVTGPKLDSPLCHARGCDSPYVEKFSTDNVNKILVIDEDARTLIACGSVFQGACEKFNMSDISLPSSFIPLSVAANDALSSTYAFVGPESYSSRGRKNVLYVGTTFTNNGEYRHDVPAISSRKLYDLEFAAFSFSKQSLLRIDVKYRDQFLVEYVYGFSSSDFAYFVIVQKQSHLPGQEEKGYVSRLARTCIGDENYDSYTEVTLQCNVKSDQVDESVNYNLIQDAKMVKAGDFLAKHLGINGEVLVGTFSPSKGIGNKPLAKSAVCVYSLQEIEAKFNENIHMCFNGSLKDRNLGYISGLILDGKCPSPGSIGNVPYFCEAGLKISGVMPIVGNAFLHFPNTSLTCVVPASTSQHTVIFLGTNTGLILKGLLSNESVVYETVAADPGFPILPDTRIDLSGDFLYVLSTSKILKLKVEHCGEYTSCSQCLGVKDPYCGWCSLEKRCTIRRECQKASQNSPRWLSVGDGQQCIDFEQVLPDKIPISKTETVRLTIRTLPELPPGAKYRCIFGMAEPIDAVLTSSGLTCAAPAISQRPTIPENADHIFVPLSVRSSETNKDFVSRKFAYYDCGRHSACKNCVLSRWNCKWCVYENKCVSDITHCNKVESSFFFRANPGYFIIRTVDRCPRFTSGQAVFVPNKVSKEIKLEVENIPTQEFVRFGFLCIIRIENEEKRVPARMEKEQYVVCEKSSYSYEANIGEYEAEISVVWNKNHLLDTISVILYKCDILGSHRNRADCSLCVTTNPKFDCTWCRTFCSYVETCQPPPSTECPKPRIDVVKPLNGPVEGGTLVTIEGSNLGSKKADVEGKIRIGKTHCQLVDYKVSVEVVCRTGPSPSGESAATISVGNEAGFTNSSVYFSYKDIKIESVSPRVGPQSGGTVLAITGQHLNVGSSVSASLDDLPCRVNSTQASSSRLTCTTSRAHFPKVIKTLTLSIDGAKRTFRSNPFNYTLDPTVREIRPLKSFASGGRMITVHGTNFDSIQKPEMAVYPEGESQPANTSSCTVINSVQMECPSPAIDFDLLLGKWMSRRSKYNRRVMRQLQGERQLAMQIGFLMDDVEAVKDLEKHFRNLRSQLFYVDDPKFFPFPGSVKSYKGDTLVMEGENLNLASDETDVTVTIGTSPCKVTSLASSQLVCLPPEHQPQDTDESGIKTGIGYPLVVVRLGVTLRIPLGYLKYETLKPIAFPSGAIVGISCGSCSLILVFFIILAFYKRRSTQAEREYRRIQIQMDTLESNVRSECKLAFAELQTDMTDLTTNLESNGIPALDFKSYVMNVFFPGVENHPIMNSPKDRCNTFRTNYDIAMFQFEQLINTKAFILVFIETLEAQTSFNIRDKVNVASLLMIVLMGKMEYATDILRSLLLKLVDKSVSTRYPQLMLRRTESVVEKMLTNWMALCMYDYLKDYTGSSLFLLFKAIKHQIEKGPVDAVTHDARYTISEDSLLREKIEHVVVTLQVIQNDSAEKTQCKVLNCDTISQTKSKILDSLYKNAYFSSRPSVEDVDLEWRHGRGGHLILQDVDLTTKLVDGWKKLNTLAHYGLKNLDLVSLVPRQRESYISEEQIYNSPPSVVLMDDDLKNCSEVKFYHLIKPGCEHQRFTKNDINERSHKSIPEIFLTRLLSTKGTIQKFVDDFFKTIFTANECLPSAIKWLFDLLDEAARSHSITDPEVVHAWKSNCLPLRFWVNFVKNPDFIFDVNKTPTVDSCLSVIAQTLMDSCSVTEHRLGKESPSNKLLFAKDILQYRSSVIRFYHDVRMLPQITDQEIGTTMQVLSSSQMEKFDSVAALKELYIYATRYNNQILEALEADPLCKKMHLAHKLENVACTLEGEETSTC